MNRSWYSMRVKAAPDGGAPEAEITLYDEIGLWGVRAADFVRDLKALGEVGHVALNINSPGGEVFDGLAIHNVLQRHPAKVTVRVDGLAASIASVVAMAGDEIVMPENAFMMIHDPSGAVLGTSSDMRELADTLDKLKGSLIAAYRSKTGLADDEIADLMAKETWLTAKEAKTKGFADRVLEPVKLAASATDLSRRFKNLPAALAAVEPPRASADPPVSENPMTEQKKPEAGATSAEASVDLDKIKAEHEAAVARARAEAAEAERAKLAAYAAEVKDLCAIAGQPAKALEFLAAATPVADVRKALLEARAAEAAEPVSNQHAAARQPEPVAASWDQIFAREAPHRFARGAN